MFLFCGTFFPVSNLPDYAQPFALAFPLYHMAELSRRFCLGTNETGIWIGLLYLLAFFTVFAFLGLNAMKRRLIQ
jgi:lipooligosaccharide transport system permease protein